MTVPSQYHLHHIETSIPAAASPVDYFDLLLVEVVYQGTVPLGMVFCYERLTLLGHVQGEFVP